jgi:hypothetical protein
VLCSLTLNLPVRAFSDERQIGPECKPVEQRLKIYHSAGMPLRSHNIKSGELKFIIVYLAAIASVTKCLLLFIV